MFPCEQFSVTWAEAGDGVHRVHENAETEIERSRLTCVPTIKVRSGRPLKPPPVKSCVRQALLHWQLCREKFALEKTGEGNGKHIDVFQ